MDAKDRILITGASGMVGGALVRRLQRSGFENLLSPTSRELDLRDAAAVDRYLAAQRPDYVFAIAAKVGGIQANINEPVSFLQDNLQIATAILPACHRYAVKKTLMLGSTCIYPRACAQPMREQDLMSGPLEPTNEGYALAKLATLKLAEAYHRQYGLPVVCPMPCNLYGTGDHFDAEKSHVLSALVRRFVDATLEGKSEVTLWGTGSARREFLHVDDAVDALLMVFEHLDDPSPINVGPGDDVSIAELAGMIAEAVGYRGRIVWDATRPDGMPQKCGDTGRLRELGFRPAISLQDGICRTVAEYRGLRSAVAAA